MEIKVFAFWYWDKTSGRIKYGISAPPLENWISNCNKGYKQAIKSLNILASTENN